MSTTGCYRCQSSPRYRQPSSEVARALEFFVITIACAHAKAFKTLHVQFSHLSNPNVSFERRQTTLAPYYVNMCRDLTSAHRLLTLLRYYLHFERRCRRN